MPSAMMVAAAAVVPSALTAQRRTVVISEELRSVPIGARLSLVGMDGRMAWTREVPPSGVVPWPTLRVGVYERRVYALGFPPRVDTVTVDGVARHADTVRLVLPRACLGACGPDSAHVRRVLDRRSAWTCVAPGAVADGLRADWEAALASPSFRRQIGLAPDERVTPLVHVRDRAVCARVGGYYVAQVEASDTLTLVFRGGRRWFVWQPGGSVAVFDLRGRRLFSWAEPME